MKRRKKISFKNLVLWTVFYFNLAVCLLSICCLDSDCYLFFGFTTLFSLGYMVLFLIANYDRFDDWVNGKKVKKIKKSA